MDMVTATGVSSVIDDQNGVAETFELSGTRSLSVSDIAFSGITGVEAGNEDSLTDVGAYNYALTTTSLVAVADIAFSGLNASEFNWGSDDTIGITADHLLDGESINADGATLVGSAADDQFTVISTGSVALISGEDVRASQGEVTFTNLINVDALGDGANGDLVLGATNWVLNGSESLTASGVTFSDIENAGSAGDSSTVTGQAAVGENYYVTGTESIFVDDINFSGVTTVNAGDGVADSVFDGGEWVLKGSESVSALGVQFNDVELIGQAGDDSRITGQDLVSESFSVTGSNAITVDGMDFVGVNRVRAGEGAGANDLVTGITSWQLAGSEQLNVMGINFQQINKAGVASVNSTITGQSNVGESFIVQSNNTVSVDGITFYGVQVVDSGSVSGVDQLLGGGNYALQGSKSLTTNSMTFNQIDQVGQFGDDSTVVGQASVAESFEMIGLESFRVDDIDFVGVETVRAGEGAVADSVHGALEWTLISSESASSQSVNFEEIETVGLTGENFQLTGRAGVVDSFGLIGNNQISTLDINFVGIGFVVGEVNDVVSDSGNVSYSLRNSSEAVVNNVTISGINLSTYNWTVGDQLGVTQNHQFSGQIVDSKGATIQGSTSDDHFAIVAPGQVDYSRSDFTGTGTGIVGFSNVTHVTSIDGAGDTDSVSGSTLWTLKGSRAVTAAGIEFSDIDVAGLVGDGATIVGDANRAESFNLLGTNRVLVDDIQFVGVDLVNAGENAAITDSVVGSSSWELLAHESIKASGVTFTEIESVGTAGDASTVNGSDLNGENYLITGNQELTVAGIEFDGVSVVNAGEGANADSVNGSTSWQLESSESVSAQNIRFNEVETVGTDGDNSTILGLTAVGESFVITGAQKVSVNDIAFSGVEQITAGDLNGVSDSVSGSATWQLEGSEQVSAAGIFIEQVELAGTAGDNSVITGELNVSETYTSLGTNQVEVKGITFSGVASVNAGAGSDFDKVQGATLYELTGSETVSAHSVQFNDVEFVGTAGEASSVRGRDDISETFIINGFESFSVDDVSFQGIQSVIAGNGLAVDSAQGAATWSLEGNQQVSGSGIEFSQLELAGLTGDNASLVGQNNVGESFVVTGAGLVSVNNISFTGIADVQAGGGTGNDSVEGPVAWTLIGSKALSASSMTFSEIERAGKTGDSSSLTAQQNVGEAFVITGDNALTVSDIEFTGVASVDAGDSSGTDSVRGSQAWNLQGSESVRANLISFINVEQVGVAGDASTINGQATIGEDYELLGGQSLRVDDIEFDGISQVNAGDTSGTDFAHGANQWQLSTGNQVLGNSVNFDGIETYGQLGDNSQLIGQASVGERFEIVSAETISVSGVSFTGVSSVVAGNVAGEDSVDGASTWNLQGSQSVTGGGIAFSEVEMVGLVGEGNALIGQSGVNESYVLGTNRSVTVSGMTVQGVSTIDAGVSDSDSVVGQTNEQWLLQDLDSDTVNETLTAQGVAMVGVDSATSAGGAKLTTTDNNEVFTIDGSTVEVSNIEFKNLVDIDAKDGDDRVINTIASQWSVRESAGSLVSNSLETLVNSVAVVFSDIEFVDNAGALIGSSLNTNYVLNSADSLELGGIAISGVNEIRAGSGVDELTGINADAIWTLNGDSGTLDSLVFSGFENFRAGSGQDTFHIRSGNVGNIVTGAGNDTVNLSGGSVIGVYLEGGDDSVFLTSALSQADIFDGGSGDDSLTSSLSDRSWVITNPIAGINRLGATEFTKIENLYSTADKVTVESGLAAVFTNSEIGFSNGLSLSYQNTGDIDFSSSFIGSNGIAGSVTADRLEIQTQTDVVLDTNVNTLGIITNNNGSVAIEITELDDLIISEVNAGLNGSISLFSERFGSLTAETRGVTHLTADKIVLGSTQSRWTAIGEQLNPLRMNVANSLDIVSLSYVNPEFVSSIPVITATGDRIESLSGAVASQGLKSAVQNSVVEFTQVDPAIFTDVSSYSVGVDAVYSPEGRLIAGEIIPTAETASGGDDEEKDNDSERKATAEKELTE